MAFVLKMTSGRKVDIERLERGNVKNEDNAVPREMASCMINHRGMSLVRFYDAYLMTMPIDDTNNIQLESSHALARSKGSKLVASFINRLIGCKNNVQDLWNDL